MSPAPPLPAMLVNDPHRIPAPQPGFGHSGVGLQYASQKKSTRARLLALPRIAPPEFPATVSSRRKNKSCATRVCGKTRSHSSRFGPVRRPAFATLRMLSLSVASCRNIAMSCNLLQDGVRLALTKEVPEVLERIDAQHGRIPFASVSGSTRDSVTASLRTLQLLEEFETLVCAGDYKRGKRTRRLF
jgi:hypothetical protein